jgi:hypothetical protein
LSQLRRGAPGFAIAVAFDVPEHAHAFEGRARIVVLAQEPEALGPIAVRETVDGSVEVFDGSVHRPVLRSGTVTASGGGNNARTSDRPSRGSFASTAAAGATSPRGRFVAELACGTLATSVRLLADRGFRAIMLGEPLVWRAMVPRLGSLPIG